MAEGLLRRRGKATWRFRCPFCLVVRRSNGLGSRHAARGADSAVVASPYFVETDGDTYEGLVPFLFAALPVERCPRVASHEGGKAFPVVGIRRWRNLRPEGRSRRHHVAVLRFDHGSRPVERRHS